MQRFLCRGYGSTAGSSPVTAAKSVETASNTPLFLILLPLLWTTRLYNRRRAADPAGRRIDPGSM